MKPRKTFKIKDFKSKVNYYLLHSPDDDVKGRQAVMIFLSNILMEANNYNGFQYITSEQIKKSEYGKSFGIRETTSKQIADLSYDDLYDFRFRLLPVDNTRVCYR